MGTVLGSSALIRATKQHNCFLCSLPILAGTKYLGWTWLGDGTPARMRVHPACHAYAHDRIDGWTNGDGAVEDAVETDLRENLIRWAPDGWGMVGVDEV